MQPSFEHARKLAHRFRKTYRVVESSAFSRYFCDCGDDIYAVRTQSASETSGSETGLQGTMSLAGDGGRAPADFQGRALNRSRAAPLSLTAVSEISYLVRSAWGELKNSPADCFSRGDCPAREGVPLPCGNVGVLNPHAEGRIDLQSKVSVLGGFPLAPKPLRTYNFFW